VNGKKHNSILFITTLSVYLGLVLVGASPQILAQAALTRNFDIKAEIEFEDDLDKNPDEKALEKYSDAFRQLVSLAKEFAEKNPTKFRDGKFEFDCSFILRANDASVTSCGSDETVWREFIDPFREITKAFPHTAKKDAEQAKFNLTISDSEFVLKTTLNLDSDRQAGETSSFYEKSLSEKRRAQLANAQSAVYENTEISAKNNQILIVTRLPRASIDALSARKNAQ
jgi:hypothetical protein